ncbi:MAG TPA: hypothetical protein VF582_07810 [Allosphingosinicella sp.]|jgi:hypothetical protein
MNRMMCALALLSLPACDAGGGGGGAHQNVTSIKAESAYVEQLRALSPQNRDLALRRAIQDSGQSCKRITSSQETGAYKNMATWTAHCEGGRDWAIFIAPNGDAQVRSCKHVEQLGLPGCGKAPQ